MQSSEYPARHAWADLCRVAAIFGVIVIHACGPSFYQFNRISDADWLSSVLINSFVRPSVPIFVMLSGALILRDASNSISLKMIVNRIIKVGVPLIVWSIFYLFYVSYHTGNPVDFLSIFRVPAMYHLWFVYMIIGIYLIIPILNPVYYFLKQNPVFQWYLLGLWLLITSVTIYQPVPLLALLQQTQILGYGGYFLLGGIIANTQILNNSLYKSVIIYFFASIFTFYYTWHLSHQASAPVETPFIYVTLNVFLASVAFFIIIRKISIEGFLYKLVVWASDRAFIIFFVHVIILERVQIALSPAGMPKALEIIAASAVTFAICLAFAGVLRLIPKSRVLFG